MLVLLMVGNYKENQVGVAYWHAAHTEFKLSLTIGSKFTGGECADSQM
jgi:hypothetical protein